MNRNSSRFRIFGRFHLFLSLFLLTAILMLFYNLVAIRDIRFDLTQSKSFTLSPVTLKVLEEVRQEPIKIIGFFRTDSGEREMFKELMESYRTVLRKLEIAVYDPDRFPSKTKQYRIDNYDTVIVEFRGRTERVLGIDEGKITNAVLRAIRNEKKRVCFVTGHGESLLQGEKNKGLNLLAQRLTDENYRLEKLSLLEKEVPQNTSCVIIAGPKTDFTERELEYLDIYLKQGGSLILLVDPVDPGTLTKFEKWVRQHGVNLGQDIIVDKLGKALGADFLVPVITQYPDHEITKDFSLASFLPVSRSVTIAEPLPPGIEVKPLAYTSSSSWAETDLKTLQKGDAFLDPAKDIKGPVSIACIAVNVSKEEDDKFKPFKLAVFGDSDFIVNSNVNVSGNRELILKTIAWMSGERALVDIREHKRPDTPLVLRSKDRQVLFWLPTVYLPGFILLAGIFVNWVRRKNRIRQ